MGPAGEGCLLAERQLKAACCWQSCWGRGPARHSIVTWPPPAGPIPWVLFASLSSHLPSCPLLHPGTSRCLQDVELFRTAGVQTDICYSHWHGTTPCKALSDALPQGDFKREWTFFFFCPPSFCMVPDQHSLSTMSMRSWLGLGSH